MMDVVGLLNPLKTVLDAIIECLKIRLKHEEAMARAGRESAQLKRNYALEVAKMKRDTMNDLLDRLSADQQSAVAAALLQQFIGPAEGIANDTRANGAAMLEHTDNAAELDAADIPEQDSGACGPVGGDAGQLA